MHGSLKSKYILIILLLFVLNSFAQNKLSTKTIIEDNDTIVLQAVSLAEISNAIENTLKQIEFIEDESKPQENINQIDSIYNKAISELNQEKQWVLDEENTNNNRVLDDAIQQWKNYQIKLGEWQNIVSNRTELLLKNQKIVKKNISIWNLSLQDAKRNKAGKEITLSIREVITSLNDLENYLEKELISIYGNQSRVVEISLLIDSTLKSIKEKKSEIKKSYLVRDAQPIWNSIDSTFFSKSNVENISKSIKSTKNSYSLFFKENNNSISWHIINFLLLLLLFIIISRQYKLTGEDIKQSINNGKILIHWLNNAIFITLFLSFYLYPVRQLIIDDSLQLLFLLTALFILPNNIHEGFKKILLMSSTVLILNFIQIHTIPHSFAARLLIILQNILTYFILKSFLNKEGIQTLVKASLRNYFINFVRVLIVLILLPLVANIIGFTALSAFINNAYINLIFNGIILYTTVIILIPAITLLFELEWVKQSNLISRNKGTIVKYIKKFLIALFIFYWLRSILQLFEIYEKVFDWITGIFQLSLKIGEITIEFGAVISFILVIVVTSVLARFIKLILEEEVFSRITMPRGVAGAITMLIRYFIVGWGIIISISALGVDLSQFSLLAGALGVGIGFGLQNVVFNFIAGLILAFERPIQVGDTIEVNQLMGTVKSIGVRSSTIRTFDGSEVIIPNGNLISNDVVNWTLSDRRKRRDINVGVDYGSDPHQVMEILREAAEANVNVLKNPAPWILFDGFGDNSLDFRLRIWTALDVGMTTKSQVTIDIYDRLNKANIGIPFPQHDLHIKSVEPEVQKIILEKKENSKTNKTK